MARNWKDETKATIKKMNLEERTQVFWGVSRAYNCSDGPYKGLTYETAACCLGAVEDNTDSQRILAKRTTKLFDIIIGPKEGAADNR